jgi:hypothetical protein
MPRPRLTGAHAAGTTEVRSFSFTSTWDTALGNPQPVDDADLREQLLGIEGVEEAVIDSSADQVWLILQASADPQAVEETARPIVEPHTLRVAVPPERRDRQRVRFVEVRRTMRSDQQAELKVVLEWGGREYFGTAVGDARGAVELRTAALASLDAVSSIVLGDIQLRLAGVKQVRAFDVDLVIVSLYRPDGEPRNLVGVVVQGEDPRRATAVAVLSALNRLLGNYLQLT